jgi:hypothetical protein
MITKRFALKTIVHCMMISFVTAMVFSTVVAEQRPGAQRRGSAAASAKNGSAANVDTSSQAPTGTYTASTGMSAGTASGMGKRGMGRASATGGENVTANITCNIERYVTAQDIEGFLQAQQSGGQQLLKAFSAKKFGTVMIGNQSFDINMAASAKVGSGYKIYLVSARPFSSGTGPQGKSAQGAAAGYIELTWNGQGGSGVMYTSTQVVIQSDGSVQARAGASTATTLTNVNHN